MTGTARREKRGYALAEFRFYAELADFLPVQRRGRTFCHIAQPSQSVKHVIEALGVPHTEVGLVLVNGETVGLNRRLSEQDRVAVFPALSHLIPPEPDGGRRFAADAHLGRLARYLRFAGFDTLWDNAWKDADLVAVAADQGRVILTRDRDLLMHKAVTSGCYVRDKDTLAQLADVAHRYALDFSHPASGRCLECNLPLRGVAKDAVIGRLPPRTGAVFDEFWYCDGCQRVYWRGSHWKRMRRTIASVAQLLPRSNCVDPAP